MKSMKPLALGAVALALTAAPAAAQSIQDIVIADLQVVAEKVVALAGAVPVGDYTHKVDPAVRSIGEEFMHIASANFTFPGMLGVEPPDVPEAWLRGNAEGMDPQAVKDALNESFSFLYGVVRDVDDLNRPVTVFGTETNVRGFLVITTSHLHEHLGKLISDTRSAGVVPPWSRM